MRIVSMAMVFLLLFAVAMPGMAFADEPEEAVETTEERVDQNTKEETLAEPDQSNSQQEDHSSQQEDPQEENLPVTDDTSVDDTETGLDQPMDNTPEEDENKQDIVTVLDEINQGLSLGVDVEVEKRRATVTASVDNTTQYELTDGVFHFNLEGYEPKVKQNGTEAKATYKKLEAGKYEVTVKYVATVTLDGEAHKVASERILAFQVGQDSVEAAIGAWHYYQGNEDILELHAYVEDADRGKGTWTFEVDGQKQVIDTEDLYADVWFELADPQPGKRYDAQISFNGKADGKKAKGSTTYSFQLVVPTLDYACTEKGLEMVTNLKGAKAAQGEWFFGLLDWEQEEWAAEHESGWVEGTTYKHTFKKIKPGSYDLLVDYFGDVDGEEFWTWFYEELEVEAGDPCAAAVGGPKPGDGKPGEQPDPGETVTPKEPKQTTGEIEHGAAMPKTSSQYPLGMLIGAVITLLGLGVYLMRRRVVFTS
ncbi:hypothetical protein [Desmospora activa]|uniref:LPXTG-motif cell wall-anchored protein n=1 Tax=Desmospora activa DSM 45169 TaxID=1121389 RepID=A0A2T4Z4R1_9BACL|nr:hypothetical protein [Desmospora activa]PTM56878.1 hypothetical protein C8J48_3203 [Desmospora activa DSM 45169]